MIEDNLIKERDRLVAERKQINDKINKISLELMKRKEDREMEELRLSRTVGTQYMEQVRYILRETGDSDLKLISVIDTLDRNTLVNYIKEYTQNQINEWTSTETLRSLAQLDAIYKNISNLTKKIVKY